MTPRLVFDIGAAGLAGAALACLGLAPSAGGEASRLTRRPDGLTCLSVRSGFDLLLTQMDWEAGSEVLVSAITIPDIARILREHGLVPVPVDIDPETLEVDMAFLARAATTRTRAVLLTHLFGAVADFNPAIAWARGSGLVVIEDCAQSYAADGFLGSDDSDVRMFSFGPIKTATALGGAVLLFRDPGLASRMKARHLSWPLQPAGAYLGRVAKHFVLLPLRRPWAYGAAVAILRILGRDHDEMVTRLGRGFAGGDFFARLRHRPCRALERTLDRRLATYDPGRVQSRARAGELLLSRVASLKPLGFRAGRRTHWIYPLRTPEPDGLILLLRAAGFDATRASSSLFAVKAEGGREEARAALSAMDEVVYVPAYPQMGERRLERLAEVLNEFSGATAGA